MSNKHSIKITDDYSKVKSVEQRSAEDIKEEEKRKEEMLKHAVNNLLSRKVSKSELRKAKIITGGIDLSRNSNKDGMEYYLPEGFNVVTRISLITAKDVAEFVNLASKADFRIDIMNGEYYRISARSLLGATVAAMEWDKLYAISERPLTYEMHKFIV